MKKVLGIFAVLALLAVSCGPSAEQKEEKRINDSIALADSLALNDSLNSAQPLDSLDLSK